MPDLVAEIVSVGTEILLGQIADTDAQHLGKILPKFGILHRHRQTVGDNLARLTDSLNLALSRSDIVFTIGGLGPTDDDLTREGIAAALGEELVPDEAYIETLRRLFASRGYPWADSQRKQGLRPACASFLPNPNGTAPGLLCEKNGKVVIAMPGPRGEFVPMADGPVSDYLQELAGGDVIHSRVLRIIGLGESIVEERVRHLLSGENPTLAPYAHPGEVHLRLTARAESVGSADALLDPLEVKVREALGNAVFGVDEVSLEEATLALLRKRGHTVAVAESLTGGGLGERFTAIPGASDTFLGGVIAYTRGVKEHVLGVDARLLEENGTVSAACAEAMAERVRLLTGATYGVSVTGNAGPTSEPGERPVGLVFVAVAREGKVDVEEHRFRGQREFIRRRAGQSALTLLRSIALAP